MTTIFICMMLKVLGSKSPIICLLQRFRLSCLVLFFFFFGSQTGYSLILYYKAKS